MKQLLNTLYVTTQGTWLTRERENVLVRVEQETRMRFPIHTLGSIVCFGQVSASAPLMGLCAERGVALVFLTEWGRFLARVHGPVSGNVLLRRQQYRWADDPEQTAQLVRTIVAAKIANSRTVLQRALRDRPDADGAQSVRHVWIILPRFKEVYWEGMRVSTVFVVAKAPRQRPISMSSII